MVGLFQHHFLGQEPVEQRNASHRQGRERHDHEGHRHQAAQAPQAPDVAGVGLVVDDACGHEQSRLERRVVQDVKHRRHGAKGRAGAQKHGDQAQMADGGKGQQRLEIMLEQRNHRAQHHGDQTRPWSRSQTIPVVPDRTGHIRAIRKIPAFTIVAECR